MKNKKTRIAITGPLGKMGQALIFEIKNNQNAFLSAAIMPKNHSSIKKDIGETIGIGTLGVPITDTLNTDKFDVLIDFTTPKSTLKYLKYCSDAHKNIIIGTTGFSEEDLNSIKKYSQKISILLSSNFSIGMNILFELIKKTTQIIGKNSDIEIIEEHHRNKTDAPSGTSLTIAKIITKVMNWNLDESAIYSRKTLNGARKPNKIGFSTIRAGDIVGKHSVMFAGIGEQINITHIATNRSAFAKGAIQAAIWIHEKKYGLFNMKDMLNF